jgi:hypothetical protein
MIQDIDFYRQTAVELLANLVSLPESSKLGVKHGPNQWMSDIPNGTIQTSTVAPLLEILIRNGHGNTSIASIFGRQRTHISETAIPR